MLLNSAAEESATNRVTFNTDQLNKSQKFLETKAKNTKGNVKKITN
jgi:hypothetical protein